MLDRLTINNLAIIENADIRFKEGFSVLTGPTGAGKSLVIDSLSLLLGNRASIELIRAGTDKATIRGEWKIESKKALGVLYKMGIDVSSSLVIERIIGKSKNSIKINGVNVSLGDLNKIAPLLADIHSQMDFAKILNKDNYLSIIDGYSPDILKPYKEAYEEAYLQHQECLKSYEELLNQKKTLQDNRDFYKFQYDELSSSNLIEGEEESIEKELALLKNYDKAYSLGYEADSIIRGESIDKLYELNKLLSKLSEYDSRYEQASKLLDEKYYELEDLFSSLKKVFSSLDYDPERLNELQQREYDLSALKRKYRKSVDELISYRDELKSLLGIDKNIDLEISSKKGELDESYSLMMKKGKDLSSIRKEMAHSIEKDLKSNLADLLLRAEFEISFSNVSPTIQGLDEINFLIETNIGEGKKNLDKIVSGGEASRIMLAFKAIFLQSNNIETAIFDEIDTGISGEEASAVAKKIKEISLYRQVIAITHMPQVASLSDVHLMISKSVKDGRTTTSIKELSLDEKIEAVAYLISGGKVTEAQKEYAKEMVLKKR